MAQPKTELATPCREYRGPRNQPGNYGRRRFGATPPKHCVYLHRWIWEQVNGPIPKGLRVLHRCDNPPCFRLDHLFLGTDADNAADMKAKGRRKNIPSIWGSAHGRAKLSEDEVRAIRKRVAEGGITRQDLGAEYGVHPSLIGLIVKGKIWKRVQ